LLRIKRWEKTFQANGPQKQAGVAILLSDKVDLKLKLVRRDKEGHFTLIKGKINEEQITIVNIYVPNVGTLNFIKQTLLELKAWIDPNTMIVGDFNTKR
jgi:exonuclease III